MENPRPHIPSPLRPREAGMTILEIMIVLAIIALVMGFLVGPQIMKRFGQSRVKTAHAIAKKFAFEAFPQWTLSNQSKSCPESLAALTPFMANANTKDPWGEDFVLLCGEAAPEAAQGIGIVSKGEDKKLDTADDVKSWQDPPSD